MVALTDSIIDITGEVVSGSDIHTAFVRSPAQRPSYTGQGLVSTRPVDISDAGELSLDLEPGPAVLVVIGDRFRDTWTLHVEEGQTTIRDAVAAVPGVLTQHEVSVLRTLLDGAEEAAVTAGNAAGQATTAAQQTGQDRSHVDQVRALLDETYDESQAGMALPPRLMESALKATYEPKSRFSANSYGASPDASWETNRDAFNAAITAAHVYGGGAVVALPGTYTVKGIVQKSHTTLHGPFTLEHPDGTSGHIVAGELFSASGSIAAGTRTLTLDAPAPDLEVGSVVAIRGAGGMSEAAISTLSTDLGPTDIAITLTNQASLFGGGSFLVVGAEIIQYTSAANGVLSGVTRGALGTAAGAYAAGTWIGQAVRLYARVESIDGNTVILDRPAKIGVVDAAIQYGITRPAITGGVRFEGNRPPGNLTNPFPVSWETASLGYIDVLDVNQAEAALDLRHGTMDCTIDVVNAHNCGNAPVSGSAVWMFRGCEDNHFGIIRVSGSDSYIGVYLDDRTTTSTEFDGSGDGNSIGVLDMRRPWSGTENPSTGIGISIVNNRNTYVGHIRAHGLRTPIVIGAISQVFRPDNGPTETWAKGNRIAGGVITGAYQPWAISAPGQVLANLSWETFTGRGGYEDFPVRLVNTSRESGQAPASGVPAFPDGTSNAPGISFADDPTTGFRRMTKGDVAYISDTALKMRFRPTAISFVDGYNFVLGTGAGTMLGTGSGQKIGFWGATPAAQPAAVANATDAASTQAQLNELLARLRSIGIIAPQ